MKNILILSLITIFSQTIFAQSDTVYNYLDSYEQPVSRDLSVYRSKVYKENTTDSDWKIDIYDVSALVATGHTKDAQGLVRQGDYQYFDRKGNKIKAGRYENNQMEGEWNEWFGDGKLSSTYHYHNGKKTGSNIGWYEEGNLSDSAMLDANGNGAAFSYFKDGKTRYRGNYKEGLRNGLWEYFYEFPAVGKSMEVNFETDSVITRKCFTETGTEQPGGCIFEKEATFPGGDAAWKKYLIKKLTNADFASYMRKINKYQVIVKFIVRKDGTVADVSVETPGPNKKLDKIAMSIIEDSPAWEPAIQYNRKVNAYRRQPITFQVE